jgi:predicted membrane channel-forming protein YqfA (hemolysin III family)
MTIDKHAELFIVTSLAIIAALGVCYSLYQWHRTGRPVMLLLFVAGGCMMVFEPLVDTVGACWFPKDSWVAFEAWGRPMPIWLCLAYFFWVFREKCG